MDCSRGLEGTGCMMPLATSTRPAIALELQDTRCLLTMPMPATEIFDVAAILPMLNGANGSPKIGMQMTTALMQICPNINITLPQLCSFFAASSPFRTCMQCQV